MTSSPEKKEIVIIGGGIIGCTSAYFLTRHPDYDPSKHNITLLEASKIAGGASGKAGGLLALWAYPSNIVPLSYRLHAQLAKEHGGETRWGYRRIHCGQLSAKGRLNQTKSATNGHSAKGESLSLNKRDTKALGKMTAAGIPKDLNWFSPESVRDYSEMGDPSTTAQVHPYQFTTAMAELAQEKGVNIILNALVTSIDTTTTRPTTTNTNPSPAVKSVTYKSTTTNTAHTLPATTIILAAGPWTQRLHPPAPISATRAHSITITPSHPITPYAIFTEIALPPSFPTHKNTFLKSKGPHSKTVTPEIYARPDNSAYACGEGDHFVPLPATTADVETDLERCQDIVDYISSISDELRDGEVTARQACYLPNVDGGGGPLVGETGTQGLLLAAGHTCWGIQNGPGTGKLVSEFVFEGGAKSADVRGLDPRRVGC